MEFKMEVVSVVVILVTLLNFMWSNSAIYGLWGTLRNYECTAYMHTVHFKIPEWHR